MSSTDEREIGIILNLPCLLLAGAMLRLGRIGHTAEFEGALPYLERIFNTQELWMHLLSSLLEIECYCTVSFSSLNLGVFCFWFGFLVCLFLFCFYCSNDSQILVEDLPRRKH